MPDDLDNQAEAAYQRDKRLVDNAVSAREIFKLGWLRGRQAGHDAGARFALIGEHVNEPLIEKLREQR